jgi:hypothetical protein
MAGKSRIQIARPDIIRYFDQLPQRVHKQSDLAEHLSAQRDNWRLTQSQTLSDFIAFLIKSGKLWKVEFPFPKPYKKETRYPWGEVPMYEVMLALKPKSFFSHYTAVRFHDLSEQVPKTTYINHEQPSPSIPTGQLSQTNIDSAFRRPPRASNYVAEVGDFRICVLNSKNTGNLGVIEQEIRLGSEFVGKVRLTNIERTLIDIAVRPVYAGGVVAVLRAYANARELASVNRLTAMLKQLGHIYPYHQAIGFYLERAGFKTSTLDLLRRLPMEFDFYLANDMKEREYVKEWRLHIPKGF